MSQEHPRLPLALLLLAWNAVLTSALVVTNMMQDYDTSLGAGVLGAGALIALGIAARR